MTSAISCLLWSSVYECQRVECAFTPPVRIECDMFVMLCECEGHGNASMGDGRSVIAVSAGCQYMGDTRGSGFVSSADDVLEMSVG